MKKVSRYYAVRRSRVPGVYHTWHDCEEQTKGFKGSRFKSFDCQQDAEDFLHAKDSSNFITSISSALHNPLNLDP
ncbi:hypothetical protein CPB83DRAFT_116852 [Crepidotus variabilis]|uniref:Ribonuclease H n=1 Tax=Crepidotus variabilis TaxID=179855 RepID=A0A9P6E4D1_9AGAR|nr:hypothetical protein CPB83DRAFT_116852 [Crepidotus variabilis]